jgi:hypothetical protein
MGAMKQWGIPAALCAGIVLSSGCQSPSSADSALDIDDILVVTSPSTTTADAANDGKTYRVVRSNNQPDEILGYDWKTNFAIGLQFNDAADDKDALTFPVTITSLTVKVQQASGGIVTPPTGGDTEHYEYVTSANTNSFAAVGANVGISFDVWYDLPSLRKEALVTVTIAFTDHDGSILNKIIDVKVAP